MWNFGDLFDAVDRVVDPNRPALVHGQDITRWGDFSARTNNLAKSFVDAGFEPGDKIGFYLRNHPAYAEGLVAACKARLTHANINYRYNADEVNYLLTNSDSKVVIFGLEFSDIVSSLAKKENDVTLWLFVDDGSGVEPPEFAKPFEGFAQQGEGKPLDIDRSPEDLVFIYTGGTTGMPKAVMWTHNSLWGVLLKLQPKEVKPESLEQHAQMLASGQVGGGCLVACPMMHGTGMMMVFVVLLDGGFVATLPSRSFDPAEAWRMVDAQRISAMIMVGDAFGKPLAAELERNASEYDLSSLMVLSSSGVMWSAECKQALLAHMPHLMLMDSFGSSEGIGFGSSVSTAQGNASQAKFTIGPGVKVFAEDGREIEPGSGEQGMIARGEPIPLGYYKDPEKTAKTFREIDGQRYSMPGDYCTVELDGTINLLGRGSGCINSGGEKIFAEEVEEVLKTHPAVYDALVVGQPDEKWGSIVTAVVKPLDSDASIDSNDLIEFVKSKIARYKAPKHIAISQTAFRTPTGKPDYGNAKAFIAGSLETSS